MARSRHTPTRLTVKYLAYRVDQAVCCSRFEQHHLGEYMDCYIITFHATEPQWWQTPMGLYVAISFVLALI